MSNQLIPIKQTRFNGETQETVDARTLHERLGSQKQFADWIKARIEQGGYTQGIDFVIIHSEVKNSFGLGRPKIDYALSVDMAKDISAMENTDAGRQYRRYLFNVEKQAKIQHKHLLALQTQLLKDKPMWQKLQRYSTMPLTTVEVAAILKVNVSTVRKNRAKMRSFGLLPDAGNGVTAVISNRG